MRTILIITAVIIALVAPTALAELPFNSVKNGGFESNLSGWQTYSSWGGSVSVVAPGAAGTAKALSVPNNANGAYAYQRLPSLPTQGIAMLVEFHAKSSADPARTGGNILEVIAKWEPSTGRAQLTTWVNFRGDKAEFGVFGGQGVTIDAPKDRAWHHYRIVLAGALGTGLLFVDDVLVAQATGNPASVSPPEWIIVGDVSSCDCGRPAPDVVYDEIYVGPKP